jgi:hypothetical protein
VKLARIALALVGVLAPVLAQNAPPLPPPAKPSAAVREMRHRLMLVSTRAIAYFHSADSIEQNLRSAGMALHPQIVVLRVRAEAFLNEARAALDQGDLETAGEALDQAQACVDRLAARLGG